VAITVTSCEKNLVGLLWLNFVNSTLPLFHDAIRKAEAQEVTAVVSRMIVI
jgi:hypothetical protein